MPTDWSALARRLQDGLGLAVPPIAITFGASAPAGVPAFAEPMPPPKDDGRTGRVSAGCVFWMKSVDRTFSTAAEDHANCSVGSVTHGFQTLADVAHNEDVAALLECNWVSEAAIPAIPVVTERPGAVTYGPLADTPGDPDVALLRVTGRQLMVLHDAFPNLRIEGKPQCHIVAIAKEQGEMAASVGCQLSRVRTGMPNGEMTCAIPAAMIAEVADRIEATAIADNAVARYASEDMKRFA
ncbi:MAG: DUF169 domain-containing protein [Chloroflexi bacterium]|nr:DUF169 domain-containing protein [Chloroflexota bacterium]